MIGLSSHRKRIYHLVMLSLFLGQVVGPMATAVAETVPLQDDSLAPAPAVSLADMQSAQAQQTQTLQNQQALASNVGLVQPAIPVRDALAFHQTYVNLFSPDITQRSVSGNSFQHYFLSYHLHGILSAYEGTQDEALLQTAMRYIENMLKTAQTVAGTPQWGPFDSQGRPNPIYNFQGAGPIARAAAIIMQNPSLRAKYGAAAERYVQFVDAMVFKYWFDKDRGIYQGQIPWLSKELGGTGWYPEWNDKSSHTGMLATFLYQATGQADYRDIAERVAKGFQSYLKPSGAGWIWDNGTIPIGSDTNGEPGSVGNQAGTHDTTHANREPMMMVFMHEAGIAFTREDIDRMAHTLTDTIWNQSLTTPMFSNYINGSNAPYRVYLQPGEYGNIYSGWALLGRYSTQAQTVLNALLNAIVTGQETTNITVKNNGSQYGRIALTGHMVRNRLPATPTSTPTPVPVTPPSTTGIYHTVAQGQSAWLIAKTYGITVNALATANGLTDPSRLAVGQRLLIPGATAPVNIPTAPAPTPAPATTPTLVPAPAPAPMPATSSPYVHTVARGQSLWLIAKTYGVPLAAVVAANQLADPSRLAVGQRIVIPGIRHTVARGQTLWLIAKAYGVTLEALVAANRLADPNRLAVGQSLFIPGAIRTVTVPLS